MPRSCEVACPRSDEHRVKAHLVDHLFDREQASDERIAFELHAKLPQLLDLRVDHFVAAEIRNPVTQYATGLVERFVYGDVAAGFRHVGGACHSGRARSHDADPEAGGFDVGNVGPAFADREIADEALEAADRHGFQRLTDDAHAFALAFLRAHASADRGQGLWR